MPLIVINSFPQTISSIDPFEVSVTITGAKKAINYLKVEIYEEGTQNFLGETFNGENWYSGADAFSYFPININGSSVSATIKARAVNLDNGDYKLKVKRFTASGNPGDDKIDPVNITIQYQKITPTPVLITQTPLTPTISLIPTPSPIQTTKLSSEPEVLAMKTISPSLSPHPDAAPKQSKFPIYPAVIFAFGLFLFGISLFLFVKKGVNQYNGKDARNHQEDY